MFIVVHDQEDDEACEGDGDCGDDEDEAHPQPVRERRGEHREREGARPGWHGEQLRANRTIAQGLDDRGCEIRWREMRNEISYFGR